MIEQLQKCVECTRVNCTGCIGDYPIEQRQLIPSDGGYSVSITCHTCGVELIDLQEQLELDDNQLRNLTQCIICGQKYAGSNCDHRTHFPIHFKTGTNVRFNCIGCTPNANAFAVTCHHCQETFPSKRAKKDHLYNCSDNHAYHCLQCTRTFVTPIDLKKHRKKHHKITFRQECIVCPQKMTFQTIAEKLDHVRNVHLDVESGKYFCSICTKLFPNMYGLRAHVVLHKGERNFICDICGQAFARISLMQYHVSSVHVNHRNFVCDICPNKKFKTLVALKAHMRANHGPNQYRYACDMCDRVFKDCSDRRRHRWSHGGFAKPHACHWCDKAFYEMKQLRAHLKSHNENTV